GEVKRPGVLQVPEFNFCKGGLFLMVISVNGSPVTLDMDSILLWALVGLVAGFLASHLALGHGLGLIWDIVVGILGALFGGIVLAGMLHFSIAIARSEGRRVGKECRERWPG